MESMPSPSYKGLLPASGMASRIARAGSAKRNTKPELMLRRALRGTGLRYKPNVAALPGCPDMVVPWARLAVFCDGDFWHGRHLEQRLARLTSGHNPQYWVAKIKSNVERDRRIRRALRHSGWKVLRLWESDIVANPQKAAMAVLKAARKRSTASRQRGGR